MGRFHQSLRKSRNSLPEFQKKKLLILKRYRNFRAFLQWIGGLSTWTKKQDNRRLEIATKAMLLQSGIPEKKKAEKKARRRDGRRTQTWNVHSKKHVSFKFSRKVIFYGLLCPTFILKISFWGRHGIASYEYERLRGTSSWFQVLAQLQRAPFRSMFDALRGSKAATS